MGLMPNFSKCVGKDVIDAIMHFFTPNDLLLAFNSTVVALVPKCSPRCMKDFRPISCCTVVYKCITKVLTNRMKNYLFAVIGKSQNAFI